MASSLDFLHQAPVTFLNPITRLLWAMRRGERPEYDQMTFFGAREGGKTHAFNGLVCMCLGLNLSVTFYLLRYLKTDIYQSVWSELLNRLIALGWLGERPTDVQARVTYREFRRGNVLVICKGLHQSQRDRVPIKGQFQYTTDYCIAVFEECDEMDLEEHLDIQIALRSPRLDVHAVVINMGNPLRESNQFSRRVDEWLPYNQVALHTRYYDQRVITYPLQIRHLDGQWETVYTRHLVVRHALDANKYALANPRTMAKMAELERTQPQKYLAGRWGQPVALQGDAFSHLVQFIGKATRKEVEQAAARGDLQVRVGVDFGIKKNATACVVVLYIPEPKCYCLIGEGKFDPTTIRDEAIVVSTISRSLVNWLLNMVGEFTAIKNYLRGHVIRVQCDGEDYAFIEQLNKTAFKMNADRYFRFVPCKKSLLINRIDHISIILGNRELSVLPSLQGLKRELMSATWEEKQERLVKQDDHLIDAFSYALWDTMRDKKFMEKKFLYNANNRLNGGPAT